MVMITFSLHKAGFDGSLLGTVQWGCAGEGQLTSGRLVGADARQADIHVC